MLAFVTAPFTFTGSDAARSVLTVLTARGQGILFNIFHSAFSSFKFGITKFIIFGITKYSKSISTYNFGRNGVSCLKTRKLALGDRNIVGARVTEARKVLGMKQVELLAKLQLAGVDMSVPALSLLEGQKRPVTDIELNALADALQVSAEWLLGRELEGK